jgi:N-methylhydantoinase A/oxoprolinase/acetone carboxylase beta subunit
VRIGIDIGGTNTDAVLMDSDRVVASHKSPTTDDVRSGVERAIRHVLTSSGIGPSAVERVVIGTTHFTNAVVQRRGLEKVGAVRLGAPATRGFPPFMVWPPELREAVQGIAAIVPGGVNFDNSPITALDEKVLQELADRCVGEGITSVAITEVFAPVNRSGERLAGEIMQARQPSLRVTLSGELGNLGLLERENATILNACLLTMATDAISSIRQALETVNIACPFFLSQNDGTLMSADYAAELPVRTFASGPTNSIRGAGFLAGVSDALVVDIGGTTTDVGALWRGYPRESANTTELAQLRTNFRMPDLISIGLGGGSIVAADRVDVCVGPKSVANRLTQEALVFGGSTLTATDIAVAAGLLDLGDRDRVADLDPDLIRRATRRIREIVEQAVDSMRFAADRIPIIVVGGGAALLGRDAFAGEPVVRPDFADVANAVGSAVAQVGGESDQVYSFDTMTRDEAVELALEAARAQCIAAGADEDAIEIVELDELPLTYLPGQSVRIRVKAVGEPKS